MQQGAAYDYLSDPTGGHRMYDNPMLSWGMIGTDIGLTFGYNKIAQGMTAAHSQYLRASFSRMSLSQKTSMFGAARAGPVGPKFVQTATGEVMAVGQKRTPRDTKAWRSRAERYQQASTKRLGRQYQKFGAGLRGIGWFAAIAGIADLGFHLASEMARPGVSREAQERDREMLSNSEGMLDTRMAYTQRQRAIQAIHDSQISIGRSMIGQESSYLHR